MSKRLCRDGTDLEPRIKGRKQKYICKKCELSSPKEKWCCKPSEIKR